MNILLIARYLGVFMGASVLFLTPALLWAVYFGEWNSALAFVESMAVCSILGLVLYTVGRFASNRMYQREALGLVGLGWLLVGVFGALPYWFSGLLPPIPAFFESVSGFTTTGATVLNNIEASDKSLLFWRALTHWLGGMGIIVLFIAVLPYLGAGGKQLFRTESSGPDPRGLRPRIRETARFLYRFYLGMTVLQTVLLMLAGMDFYDAICHTMSTLATGGFSPKNASIGHYDSVLIEFIIIVFMILAATNFALYFNLVQGDWKGLFKNTELRWFLGILALATILITINITYMNRDLSVMPTGVSHPEFNTMTAFRQASFQVVSLMTGTGFGTADFDAWPDFSRVLLLVLMFLGGCAGSTSGGLKVIRIVMLFKMAAHSIESKFRPKMVRAIRVNDVVIDEGIQKTVYSFFVLNMALVAFGTLFMAALGLPIISSVSSVVACLFVVGPGFEFVGPTESFANIPDPGKILLSIYMVLGRLELFTVMVMFFPSFWRHD